MRDRTGWFYKIILFWYLTKKCSYLYLKKYVCSLTSTSYQTLHILVGPTVNRLVLDPLAVLFLDNQLYIAWQCLLESTTTKQQFLLFKSWPLYIIYSFLLSFSMIREMEGVKNIFFDFFCFFLCTISTSESELIDRTYMVTPTTTSGPVKKSMIFKQTIIIVDVIWSKSPN